MHFKYNSYSHYVYHIVKFAAAGKQSNKVATGQRPVVYTRISKKQHVYTRTSMRGNVNTALGNEHM